MKGTNSILLAMGLCMRKKLTKNLHLNHCVHGWFWFYFYFFDFFCNFCACNWTFFFFIQMALTKWDNFFSVFPVTTDVPFPKTFQHLCRKILTRLFRVFVHVYIHHFDRIVSIGAVNVLFLLLKFLHFNQTIEHSFQSKKKYLFLISYVSMTKF